MTVKMDPVIHPPSPDNFRCQQELIPFSLFTASICISLP
jgi:hypothetical protein